MKEVLKKFTELQLNEACFSLMEELNIKLRQQPTFKPIDFPVLYKKGVGSVAKCFEEVFRCIKETYIIGEISDASLSNKNLDVFANNLDAIDDKYQSMMVFAVEMNEKDNVTRSMVANLTRAFNRMSKAKPVILFIKQGNLLSLATCERMDYTQEWRQGERIGKVSLLRNINCGMPHRGHIDILESLGNKSYPTFEELYKHWMEVFSSELLTKKFYTELSDWYAWAVQVAKFPNDLNTTNDDTKYNQEACIRLITRLIFVWFLKQKHLIPDEFFDEKYIRENFINDFNPHGKDNVIYKPSESKYYRLILQNLFFAMLNCPIVAEGKSTPNNRRFVRESFQGKNPDYGINNIMRYKKEFMEGGADKFLKYANSCVPFLNGGLFDCLDNKDKQIFYDGFSEEKKSLEQLSLPDYLFFGEEVGKGIDLSQWYDDKKKKNVSVRGLIEILKRYNFTIEENTPYDQEVSLDPELLGKVFENLLAAYNPETEKSAREQTGSYYTPREVVQYMVDESLVAHFKRMCGDDNDMESKYRQLLSYAADEVILTDNQRKSIMSAIYNCRVLDPACGSGAFPMGILQQMVHVLKRIDPSNVMWNSMMIDIATEEAHKELEKVASKAEIAKIEENRQARLDDIESAFNQSINDPDYARKLYLIEHCIYGVDIQPIATQISKLRFFISLVVDQKPTKDAKSNFGIRPLPNLEAKFVTANTLIPLERSHDLFSTCDDIRFYEKQLQDINHRIFLAKKNSVKHDLQQLMYSTRAAMAQTMQHNGFIGNKGYLQLMSWDMFDQNASSSFFDAEWMFGVKKGFDIVIANPPYVNVKRGIPAEYKKAYERIYKTAIGQYDLFVFFIELGLKIGTVNCMIVPKPILNNENYMVARSLMLENRISEIVTGSDIFDAGVESCIFLTNNQNKGTDVAISHYENGLFTKMNTVLRDIYKRSSSLVFSTEICNVEVDLIEKLNKLNKFENIFNVKRGVEAGKKDESITDHDNGYHLLRGEDVSKYSICYDDKYIDYDESNISKFKEISLYNNPKILLRRVGNTIQCVYDNNSYIVLNTIYCITFKTDINRSLEAYTAILNSKLVAYWFFKTYCNTDKLFPYIRISQLNNIPIPDLPKKCESNLTKYVNAIFNNIDESIISRIDLIVYKLYELSYDEVLVVDPETPISREEYENFKLD